MDQPVIVRKGTVEETMRRLEKYGVETKNKVLGKLDGTPVSSHSVYYKYKTTQNFY